MVDQNEEGNRRRAYLKSKESDILFRRADSFRQLLMEDFRFMEAARMHSGEYEGATLSTSDLKPRKKLEDLMNTNPQGLVNFASYHNGIETENDQRLISTDVRTRRYDTRMSQWPPLNIWAHWLLNTKIFSYVMVCVIVLNAILIATDQYLSHGKRVQEGIRIFLEVFDFLFLFMFVGEIILKWIDDFPSFWEEGWNIFDFLITSTSLVAPVLDIAYPHPEENGGDDIIDAVKYLRIIRILRTLNVVTRIQKIQMIWGAVVRTFSAMVFIISLMLIFFYIFAIMGIQIFEEFTKSHKTNIEYRDAFKNLGMALITLFQIFTLDHYYNIQLEIDKVMDAWIPTTYVLLWIMVGSFIFGNIFVGVMVNTFQNIRSELVEETSSILEKRRIANQHNLFGSDDGESDPDKDKVDPIMDWEAEVHHTLEIVRALGNDMSPTMWPRDSLFQYFMILEALASNLDERNVILRQLDHAVLRNLDP